MTINQDAIAEVKILRNNYAAEYGNNGGAMINLISKGGGKQYRGTAYYFIRNEALNASPFFINQAGLDKPLYRHNIWGFNFGGPLPLLRFGENDHMLLKNKAFFFFSYERPHTITPTDPATVTVPTELERPEVIFHSPRQRAGEKYLLQIHFLQDRDSLPATLWTRRIMSAVSETPHEPRRTIRSV